MNTENVWLRCLLKLQRSKSSFPIAKDFLCTHWQLFHLPLSQFSLLCLFNTPFSLTVGMLAFLIIEAFQNNKKNLFLG